MGVVNEFAEQNFFRETHCVNRARKVALLLRSVLCDIFPAIFPEPPRVSALENQGWMNLTLLVESADGYSAYILRLSERPRNSMSASRSVPHFEKERYILDKLRDFESVPNLVIPATGVVELSVPGEGLKEYGYLLQTYLPFRPGSAREVTRDRSRVLEQLGAHLVPIHKVVVEGFGTDFSERNARFAFETYEELIAERIRWIEESPVDTSMKRWLETRLKRLMNLKAEPCLYHRDLLGNWGNFLVDGDSRICGIIDWEFAGSGLPLHGELASMIYVLHRDGAPQEQIDHDVSAFLRGYGISRTAYRQHYEYDTETLVLLNSVAALVKFEVAGRDGALEKEPWRKVFAARAKELCHSSYLNDSRGSLPRRLAA